MLFALHILELGLLFEDMLLFMMLTFKLLRFTLSLFYLIDIG